MWKNNEYNNNIEQEQRQQQRESENKMTRQRLCLKEFFFFLFQFWGGKSAVGVENLRAMPQWPSCVLHKLKKKPKKSIRRKREKLT